MNWQEIIKPGKVTSEGHTQNTQNTQKSGSGGTFEYFEYNEYTTPPLEKSSEYFEYIEDSDSDLPSNPVSDPPVQVKSPDRKKDQDTQKLPLINAFDWISDHIDELTEAGFTSDDLFSPHLPIGIAHCHAWDKPFMEVVLEGDTLYFSWTNPAGKKITQTCRPESHIGTSTTH